MLKLRRERVLKEIERIDDIIEKDHNLIIRR